LGVILGTLWVSFWALFGRHSGHSLGVILGILWVSFHFIFQALLSFQRRL
jgi:hypothetical protein